MSLAKFKKRLKIFSAVSFLALYGALFFFLGKTAGIVGDIVKVKGASTQKGAITAPVESPVPFADTQTAKISSSFVKICSNTVFSLELSYPKDWFTTYNDEEQRCTFFAPYSFVVPYDTSQFIAPITLTLYSPGEWIDTTKYYENPNDFFNVVSSENIQFGERPAKKIEAHTTGEGQLERGLLKTTYLIFDATRPLAISYQQMEKDEDVNKGRSTLEDIAKSIKFF